MTAIDQIRAACAQGLTAAEIEAGIIRRPMTDAERTAYHAARGIWKLKEAKRKAEKKAGKTAKKAVKDAEKAQKAARKDADKAARKAEKKTAGKAGKKDRKGDGKAAKGAGRTA